MSECHAITEQNLGGLVIREQRPRRDYGAKSSLKQSMVTVAHNGKKGKTNLRLHALRGAEFSKDNKRMCSVAWNID